MMSLDDIINAEKSSKFNEKESNFKDEQPDIATPINMTAQEISDDATSNDPGGIENSFKTEGLQVPKMSMKATNSSQQYSESAKSNEKDGNFKHEPSIFNSQIGADAVAPAISNKGDTNFKHEGLSASCRHMFHVGETFWQCHTCQLELKKNMCICNECFVAGQHEGHDVTNSKIKEDGWICVCGDIRYFNVDGCCKDHELTLLENEQPLVHFMQKKCPKSLEGYVNSKRDQLDVGIMNIGDEDVEKLGEALSINTFLTKIVLSNNQIGDVGVQALRKALQSNTSITHIEISFCGIGDDGAISLGRALQINKETSITNFLASFNEIGAKGAEGLAEALSTNNSLVNIDISNNNIGSIGARALGDALIKNTSLANIDVNSNNIGPTGAKAFGQALINSTSLTSLVIGYNKIGDAGAKFLSKALVSNASLTNIDIQSNAISDEGAAALGEALNVNTVLTTINLSFNKIADKGAKALADALIANTSTSLANIFISFNQIGAEGSRALGKALLTNTSLTSIDVKSNNICDKGAIAFGEALCKNTTLTSIDISFNNIGPKGAKALADALRKNDKSAITSIAIKHNKIGDDGAKALGKALMSNKTVTTIDAKSNRIGDGGVKALGVALLSNTSLRSIDISHNDIGNGARVLREALKKNNSVVSLSYNHNRISNKIQCQINDLLQDNEIVTKHLRYSEDSLLFYVDIQNADKDGKFYWHRIEINDTENDIENKCEQSENCKVEGEPIWDAAKGTGKALEIFHRLLRDFLLQEGTINRSHQKRMVDLLDRGTNKEGSTLLHVVAALQSSESYKLCQFLVKIGAGFDKVVDQMGRSARDVAMANPNSQIVEWAQTVGTYLGRYIFEDSLKHESSTSVVRFAIDMKVTKNHEHRMVALKIMKQKDQFERELERRLRHHGPYHVGFEEDVSAKDNIFDEKYVVPIIRYHIDVIGRQEIRCLVMPKGENLAQVIDSEIVAGKDFNEMRYCAREICMAVQHIHTVGNIIHGDLGLRNIIRLRGEYKLIDFDASVFMGETLTGQKSTGCVPPEYARRLFVNKHEVDKLREEYDKQQFIVNNINSTNASLLAEKRKSYDLIQHINLLDGEKARQVSTNAVFDVWGIGMILYTLFTGEDIFRVDIYGNIIKDDDKKRLVTWNGLEKGEAEKVLPHADPDLKQQAIDLLSCCLAKDEAHRFQSLDEMLKHKFLSEKQGEGIAHLRRSAKKEKDKDVSTSDGGSKKMIQPNFEPNDINIPTQYIILPYKLRKNKRNKFVLPSNDATEEYKAAFISLQNASAILNLLRERHNINNSRYTKFKLHARRLHKTNRKEAVESLLTFVGISLSAYETIVEILDAVDGFWDDPLDALRKSMKSIVEEWLSKYRSEKCYFYLLDEYHLTPVVSDRYPIEIKQESEHLQIFLRFLWLRSHSISMFYTVATLFSLPSNLTHHMQEDAMNALDEVYNSSHTQGSDDFQSDFERISGMQCEAMLQDPLKVGNNVWATEVEHLATFFEKEDKDRDFGGLRRHHDKAGIAFWTMASEEEIVEFDVNEAHKIGLVKEMYGTFNKRDLQTIEKDQEIDGEEKDVKKRIKDLQIKEIDNGINENEPRIEEKHEIFSEQQSQIKEKDEQIFELLSRLDKLTRERDSHKNEKDEQLRKMNLLLEEKEKEISARDVQVKEKDAKISEGEAQKKQEIDAMNMILQGKEDLINHMESQIKEKDEEIIGKEGQIKEKVEQLNETILLMKGKDEVICERETQIKEMDVQIHKKDAQIKEKDGEMEKKEVQMREQSSAMDILIKEKDQQINDKDAQLKERDEQINIKEAQISERDLKINELYLLIKEKIDEIGKKEAEIVEKDKQIHTTNSLIKERDEQIDKKNSIMKEKNDQIIRTEADVKKKNEELNKMELDIKIMEGKLHDNEMQMKEKEEEVNRLVAQIKERDKQVSEKQAQIMERETQFEQIASLIKEKEELLRKKEVQIRDQERQISERESEIKQKDVEIGLKKAKIKGKNEKIDKKGKKGGIGKLLKLKK